MMLIVQKVKFVFAVARPVNTANFIEIHLQHFELGHCVHCQWRRQNFASGGGGH